MKNSNTNKTDFGSLLPKLIATALALIVLLSLFVACSGGQEDVPEAPTNEQQIKERIEKFSTAYNQGDMDAVLECLDAKSRNAMNAMLNLVGGIAGSLTGVDIDLRDLFSLGIYISSDDFMKLQIGKITVTDSKNAVATTTMDLTGAGVGTIYFYMVYENGGWYIHDMTDTPPTGNAGSTTNNSGNSGTPGTDSTVYYQVTTYSDTSQAGTYTSYNRESFAAGSTVTLEATVNDGYNFEGWYLSEIWSSKLLSTDLTYQFEMGAENAIIEARYSYYTVNVGTYNDDYGMAGTYTKYQDKKVSVGDTVVLEATVNSGYNFEGWFADWSDICLSSDLRYEFVMKAENANIEARYSYYVVNVEADNDDYGMAGTYTKYQDKKFSIGDKVVLETTVNDGYNFEGWYADWSEVCLSTDLRYEFEMNAENVHIRARYSYYTVNVKSWSDESGTAGTYTGYDEKKISVGDTVNLEATVNDGFNFEGWFEVYSDVCLSKELIYTFEMQADNISIEPRYSYYTVTTNSWSDEFGTAGVFTKKNGEKTSVGKIVTLTATVNDGYNFEGWFRDGVCISSSLTYEFTMKEENVELEARYSYYTVTVDGYNYEGAAGTYTKYDAEKISIGEVVTLTATVKSGYTFGGWYRSNVLVSKSLTYAFTMENDNVYIEAIWYENY